MAYILTGESGVARFETDGTILKESIKYSAKVSSNPIDKGGTIIDHATLDPVQLVLDGVVTNSTPYEVLKGMWANRDILTYRGKESHDNLLITNLSINHEKDNRYGYGVNISFQKINIATSETVKIDIPMAQQDSSTKTSTSAKKSSKKTENKGQTTTSTTKTSESSYSSYVDSYNKSSSTNSSVGQGRTNTSNSGVR